MRVVLYLAIGLVLTTLECSLFSFLPTEFFKPDLGVPFVIYTAFFRDPLTALATSAFMGLIQEVLSGAPPGSMLFTKVSIFVIALFMKSKLYIDSRYSFSFACSGAVLVESFLFLAISLVTRGESKDIGNVMFYAVPNAIVTGFLSLLVFSLIESLNVRYFDRH
jgi:rod shape-determining protein MreD